MGDTGQDQRPILVHAREIVRHPVEGARDEGDLLRAAFGLGRRTLAAAHDACGARELAQGRAHPGHDEEGAEQRGEQRATAPAQPAEVVRVLDALGRQHHPVLVVGVVGVEAEAHPEAVERLPARGEAGVVAELATHVGGEQAQRPGVAERLELVGGLGRIDADAFERGEIDQQIDPAVEVGVDQRRAGQVDDRHDHLRDVAGARRFLEVTEDLHPAAERNDEQQRDKQKGLPEQGARQQALAYRTGDGLDGFGHQASLPEGDSGSPSLSSPFFCSSGTKT